MQLLQCEKEEAHMKFHPPRHSACSPHQALRMDGIPLGMAKASNAYLESSTRWLGWRTDRLDRKWAVGLLYTQASRDRSVDCRGRLSCFPLGYRKDALNLGKEMACCSIYIHLMDPEGGLNSYRVVTCWWPAVTDDTQVKARRVEWPPWIVSPPNLPSSLHLARFFPATSRRTFGWRS